MRRLTIAMAVVLALQSAATAQVSRPNPTSTPQADTHVMGAPIIPSPFPTCAAGHNGFFADGNGCVYVCAGTARRLVAASSATCAFPTGAPSATPTTTATPTATATATDTPTPTVTATP